LTKPIKQEVLLQAIKNRSIGVQPLSKEESIQNQEMVLPANPKIAARVPVFLQNRRNDVITMLDALDRDDLKTVERLGHSMRGTGASYGFKAITDIGAALEHEAANADTDASRHWVGELSTYLQRVGRGTELTARLPSSANKAS
jgi:HPt (histidine-containing phosphotransfer) domain-containing protein